MIQLVFKYFNELMQFKIEGRNIYYTDRVWKSWLRCIPKDENMEKVIMASRNRLPPKLVDLFHLSNKDLEEYEVCKTEEELALVIIKDCEKKGLKLISRQ